jgi:hypothetical protein
VIVQESVLFTGLIPDSRICEFMETGNLFIEFTKSVVDENDLPIHRQSLLAAFYCSLEFKFHITNHYDTILSDIDEFVLGISTVMRDIIGTVNRRDQYPSSRCIELAQLEAEPF